MEPVFDGGLIEFLIALSFGFAINYIFLKKYLFIFYSILSVITPCFLLIVHQGGLFYIAIFLCFFNSVLLLILLWRARETNPNMPLFDLKKIRKVMLE